jgi:hypothetical protein
MVQPEDNRTIPLPLSPVTGKRGRGRPRKDSALSNAQRQAAFRARHKGQAKPVTVTKNVPVATDAYLTSSGTPAFFRRTRSAAQSLGRYS